MKKVEAPLSDVGVIVGRFHVDELHQAHKDLIKSVCNVHEKVIIFLGLAHVRGTTCNPLDFESRKQMVLEDFPNAIVLYIKDQEEDVDWSKELDEKIRDVIGPNQSVMLYGSRNSFIARYFGHFPTTELMQEVYVSGSDIRSNISKSVKNDKGFRRGAIWQAFNRYPSCYPTVDIAIFNEDSTKLLLARKPKQKLYRFVGGFADPKSESYEVDARREVMEETTLEISDPIYVGSMIVDDWRYRNEVDKIKTILFKCKMTFGRPEPKDDLEGGELRWFELATFDPEMLRPEHRKLLAMLKKQK